MPTAQKIAAKAILCIGVALGAGVVALWVDLMWPTIAEAHGRTAMNGFWLLLFGGFGLLALVVWPFAKLAEYVDPPAEIPPAGPEAMAPTAAHRSPVLPRKASRQPRQERLPPR
jgi:uncharacterized membrane protein